MSLKETLEIDSNAEEVLASAVAAARELTAEMTALKSSAASVKMPKFEGVDKGASMKAGRHTERETVTDITPELAANTQSAEAQASAMSSLGKSQKSAEKSTKALGKAQKSTGKSFDESIKGAFQFLTITALATKAVQAIKQLASAALKATYEAAILGDRLERALNVSTKGKGEAALKGLSQMASQLGMNVEEAAAQFSKFREAGATNAQSASLIKLGADLRSIGVEAATAGKLTDQAMSEIRAGKDASKAIKDIASQWGIVGDGANAAARANFTFAGAMDKLKTDKQLAFLDLTRQIKPELDEIGTALVEAFGGGEFPEDGVNAFRLALSKVPPFIRSIVALGKRIKEEMQPSIDSTREAFSTLGATLGGVKGEGGLMSALFTALTGVMKFAQMQLQAVIYAISFVVSAADSLFAFAGKVKAAMGAAIEAINPFASEAGAAGDNFVSSFIRGALGKIGAVGSAMKSVGSAAAAGLKGALGIASPSKEGNDAAENVTGTFAKRANTEASNVGSAFTRVGESAVEGLAEGTSGSAGMGSVGSGMDSANTGDRPNVTLNLTVESSPNPEETARVTWRHILAMLNDFGYKVSQ